MTMGSSRLGMWYALNLHTKNVGTSLCRDFLGFELFVLPASGSWFAGGALVLEIELFIRDDSGSSSRSSKSD